MANWDAIVIGLGGVGSAATYHLAAAGHRVLGIDRFPPPHDQGSSHGKTRIIRQAYFEHPAYVPLLRRAYELWDELQQRANSQLFYRTGLVEVGPQDGIVIPGVLRSAAERGLSIEQLSAGEMTQRWPGFPCFFHETPAGFFYGFPSVNGGGVKVARHSGGQPLDEPDATHARDEDDRKLVDNYIETC
jgi:glycine/D-amino acid oxidase-like deaminating enzyme